MTIRTGEEKGQKGEGRFTTERILGLKKVLEESGFSPDVAAAAKEEEVEVFLVRVMEDVERLVKKTPDVKTLHDKLTESNKDSPFP